MLRAWDELNKVMHYDFQYIESGKNSNDWIVFKSDKQKLEDGKVLDSPHSSTRFKIMRATGVKDIDGNSIYEGDKVEFVIYDNKEVGTKTTGVVTYDDDFAMFIISVSMSGRYGLGAITTQDDEIEIIGNIYE